MNKTEPTFDEWVNISKLRQSIVAKHKKVEKYIRIMEATKDDTERNNLAVKLNKLLNKYNKR